MNKFKFTLFLLGIISLCISCSDNHDTKELTLDKNKIFNVKWYEPSHFSSEETFIVIEIDSCEYFIGNYDRSRFLTHKGNCKYCASHKK